MATITHLTAADGRRLTIITRIAGGILHTNVYDETDARGRSIASSELTALDPVAVYDSAGNCTTCGEAGRCPGRHPQLGSK